VQKVLDEVAVRRSGTLGRPRKRLERLGADRAFANIPLRRWLEHRGTEPIIPAQRKCPAGHPPGWAQALSVQEAVDCRAHHRLAGKPSEMGGAL
jgi:hypothetical protein